MASAFIGLTVKVLLVNGTSLQGHVSDVDQITQRLTLHDVSVQYPEETIIRPMARFSVAGGEIKDLQVIPVAPPARSQPTVNSPGTRAFQLQPRGPHEDSRPTTQPTPYVDPAIISFTPPGAAAGVKTRGPPEDGGKLSQRLASTHIARPSDSVEYHGTIDHSAVAESSATETTTRTSGRRSRKNNNYNSNLNNGSTYQANANNSNNNNMSDYGSPRSSYQSVSGKKMAARKPKEAVHEWAAGDVEEFKEEDFDFQGNLELFDKKRVFAEIKEADDTAPESLLVNLNRNPERARYMGSPMQQKLAPTENVLDPAPKRSSFYGKTEDSGQSEDEDDETEDYSWNSSVEESSKSMVGSKEKGSKGGDKRKAAKIQTLSGVHCPTVTGLQMQEAEKLCRIELGISDEQMVENGGRGAAMMCLQALGGSRRIQPNNHNSAPVVVVLAGNNQTGAYAICAARHLSNHGCQVTVFVVGAAQPGGIKASVASQIKSFIPTGGEIMKSFQELPQSSIPLDLIVDGMLGYQHVLRDIVDADDRETVCDLMDWANVNKAPVLSLDVPSGVNGTTGQGDKTKFCIHPKWTLCLGAPKSGCRSRSTTGELFLTDIGIPRSCWKRVGVKGWSMPWGADFLVGLEYL